MRTELDRHFCMANLARDRGFESGFLQRRVCKPSVPAQADPQQGLGRKPTARAKSGEIRKLASEGVGKVEIAQRLGISESSVYRVLAAA